MHPRPDMRVHDRVVLDEIELYGELIIAASDSDGPLSVDQIDAILGVHHDDAVMAEAGAGSGRADAAVRSSRPKAAPLPQRSAS